MALQINKLLQATVNNKGSDLHLAVGRPPTIRIGGHLRTLDTHPLTPEDTVGFMRSITSERCQQELQESGTSDFGLAFGEVARFRVSVFKQKGNIGVVLRLIPSKLLTFEDIGVPAVIKKLITKPRGLFLVTGPTGSGKTTTLATMIDYVNSEYDKHIITIEEPIEYYHDHKKSVITQREVGVDVDSFSEALRRGLRQDPDVMLVGEMRDLETISTAITASETGHIVFATLHTTGAARTINRIIDAFPTEQQEQIRTQLSVALECVLSQLLLPRKDAAGMVAAFECLVLTDAVRHMIRENKTERITSSMQTGKKDGMVLLDDHLFELYAGGTVERNIAIDASQDTEEIAKKIEMYEAELKKKKGGLFGRGG